MSVDCGQEKKGLQVAGGVTWSFGVAAILIGYPQVQCTWKFDAWTNPRWWSIFAKVEFVGVVSNIVYKVGYSWTMSCIVFTYDVESCPSRTLVSYASHI